VKGTRAEHLVKLGLSGDDKIYLVPVFGSGMSPRRSMVELGGEEGVGNAQVKGGAEFKKMLTILNKPANAKVTEAAKPRGAVSTYPSVEVS